MLDVLHISAGSALQAQLVAELGRMRGALLLAFPDQGRALREHGMPPKDIVAAGDPGEPGAPLYDDATHQEWVQVGALATLLPSGSFCRAHMGQRSLHSGQPRICPSLCWVLAHHCACEHQKTKTVELAHHAEQS